MTVTPHLVSVRVGTPRTLGTPGATDPMERQWTTAYLKDAVEGPVRLTRTHLEGDACFDTRAHGGLQMAVLAYAAAHYPLWRDELDEPAMGPGGFGENLTIEGLDEHQVCIGDVFDIGTAQVQVSQPRGPCAAISRRWKRPALLATVKENGRTGWYFRVLREGEVCAGDAVTRIARTLPDWTVARVFRHRMEPARDPAALTHIAALELLSPEWRAKFAALATSHPMKA